MMMLKQIWIAPLLLLVACSGEGDSFDCEEGPYEKLSANEPSFLGPSPMALIELIPLQFTVNATYGHQERVDLTVQMDLDSNGTRQYEYIEKQDGVRFVVCNRRVSVPIAVEFGTADGVYDVSYESYLEFKSPQEAIALQAIPADEMNGEVVSRFAASGEPGTLSEFQIHLQFYQHPDFEQFQSSGFVAPAIVYDTGAVLGGHHGYASLSW